jgi:hypothetical protein
MAVESRHDKRTLTPSRPALARRAVLWAMLAALLFAQTLGLMHRVAHPGFVPSASAQVAALHGPAAASAQKAGGWVANLFAHDDAGCRLFDQAAHGAPLLDVPSLVLPLALAVHVFAWLEGQACARAAASFDARGPPSVR